MCTAYDQTAMPSRRFLTTTISIERVRLRDHGSSGDSPSLPSAVATTATLNADDHVRTKTSIVVTSDVTPHGDARHNATIHDGIASIKRQLPHSATPARRRHSHTPEAVTQNRIDVRNSRLREFTT